MVWPDFWFCVSQEWPKSGLNRGAGHTTRTSHQIFEQHCKLRFSENSLGLDKQLDVKDFRGEGMKRGDQIFNFFKTLFFFFSRVEMPPCGKGIKKRGSLGENRFWKRKKKKKNAQQQRGGEVYRGSYRGGSAQITKKIKKKNLRGGIF